jgi:hypothetical protein
VSTASGLENFLGSFLLTAIAMAVEPVWTLLRNPYSVDLSPEVSWTFPWSQSYSLQFELPAWVINLQSRFDLLPMNGTDIGMVDPELASKMAQSLPISDAEKAALMANFPSALPWGGEGWVSCCRKEHVCATIQANGFGR